MGPVLEGMRQLGARIEFEGEEGHLPFTVTPPVQLGNLKGKPQKVRIDSSASSQFISGLLLIGSRLPDGLILEHTGVQLPSMPHIRMTMEDVDAAGGHIEMPQRGRWIVDHAELQMAAHVVVEPDLSNAAPFLGAALIASGSVRIPNWPAHTTQPGGFLPHILHRFGASITLGGEPFNEVNDCECFPDDYNGILEVSSDGVIEGLGECDLSAIGEITPSIAAIAVFANAPSVLVGIGHLRGHETNRLEALATEINRVGSDAQEEAEGLSIAPVARDLMHGAVMETYADHRMATFAAMLGLAIDGIEVTNVETTRKTIPDFVGMWNGMLRGK